MEHVMKVVQMRDQVLPERHFSGGGSDPGLVA